MKKINWYVVAIVAFLACAVAMSYWYYKTYYV